jgi:hypothetical protein
LFKRDNVGHRRQQSSVALYANYCGIINTTLDAFIEEKVKNTDLCPKLLNAGIDLF